MLASDTLVGLPYNLVVLGDLMEEEESFHPERQISTVAQGRYGAIVTKESWRRAWAASGVRHSLCSGCGQASRCREARFWEGWGALLPPAAAVQAPPPSPSSV